VRRAFGIIGAAGLLLLGAAYLLTVEPAPRVRVLWRPDVPPVQQATLAQKYLLLNARDRLPEGSWAYDLLDTGESNIRAIVTDPAILDTNDIERHTFAVRFDTDYGGEWMWIAHRTPGLREPGVRAALVLMLALVAIGGFAKDGRIAWRAMRVPPRDAV
jgi:hypothetical protein